MHELLFAYKNNNVLLDVIKKQSKEEKFTCPNCREEFLGIISVCRLTEYLRAQSIQSEDQKAGSGAYISENSTHHYLPDWAYLNQKSGPNSMKEWFEHKINAIL